MQGPKFVSDEEIERIKAKIEEDNRAIAALDIKKFGEIEKHKKNLNLDDYNNFRSVRPPHHDNPRIWEP